MKTAKYFLVGLALACCGHAAASQLHITCLDGTERVEMVALIGRIEFRNDSLLLKDKQGNVLARTYCYDIGKITFGEADTKLVNPYGNRLEVFPNPTCDLLYIKGVDESTVVRVFDLQGKQLGAYTGGQADVSGLENGVYLLQVETSIFKFIKQ